MYNIFKFLKYAGAVLFVAGSAAAFMSQVVMGISCLYLSSVSLFVACCIVTSHIKKVEKAVRNFVDVLDEEQEPAPIDDGSESPEEDPEKKT